MTLGLHIAAILLHAASVTLLIYWAIALGRMIATTRQQPTASAGVQLKLPDPAPAIGIVIPAHNEAAVIAKLIDSLRKQTYPTFRVILALDRCTDNTESVATAAIAGDLRFEILINSICPEGWAGKVNAVWHGLQNAHDPIARSAPLLIFADADTVFAPDCLHATAALLLDRQLDLLSLLSTLTHDRWFERLAQPAAMIETITQYPILRASRATQRRAFANGQFMMFRRDAYDAIGGHAAVRDELLEDLALARLIAAADRPAAVFLADGMLSCRMYASWSEFIRGWKRIYTELALRSPRRLGRCAARVLAFGTLLPIAALANIALGTWFIASGSAWGIASLFFGIAGLTPLMIVLSWVYRLGRAPLWAVPAYLLGAALVAALLLRAARDLRAGRPIEWGGRKYIRPIARIE